MQVMLKKGTALLYAVALGRKIKVISYWSAA